MPKTTPPVMLCCDTGTHWVFHCAHCKRDHHHSRGPGHRIAHCGGDGPYSETGYVLELLPAPGDEETDLQAVAEKVTELSETVATIAAEGRPIPRWLKTEFDAVMEKLDAFMQHAVASLTEPPQSMDAAEELAYWTAICFEGLKREPSMQRRSEEERRAIAHDMAEGKLRNDAKLREAGLESESVLARMEAHLHLGGFSDTDIANMVKDGGPESDASDRVAARRGKETD